MSLDHVLIILSRPSEPRNIGATCRAMKNAGLTRLVISDEKEIDFEAARPLAVDARDVLDSARLVSSLEEAVAGAVLIAGTSRRTGQRRKTEPFTPWQLAQKVVALGGEEMQPAGTVTPSEGRQRSAAAGNAGRAEAAIVFGNEQSGLSAADLQLCHMAVSIPSHPDQPSLNLSHAVQVIAYELYVANLGGRTAAGRQPIDPHTLAAETDRIIAALNAMGFHTQEGPQSMPSLLRDVLGRAMVSAEEMERLRGMFQKLEGMRR